MYAFLPSGLLTNPCGSPGTSMVPIFSQLMRSTMATLSSSGPVTQAVFQPFAGSNAITPLPAGMAFTSWRCLMTTTETLASPALATYAYLPSGENTAILAPLPVIIDVPGKKAVHRMLAGNGAMMAVFSPDGIANHRRLTIGRDGHL